MRAKLSLLTVVTLIVLVPGARTPAASGRSHGRDFELISLSSAGRQGNNDSDGATISADSRWVAFASEASNLVAGDTPGTADVFVRDRRTHTTELISRGTDGFPAGGSLAPVISADGRFVAFRSFSDRLVPDGNPTSSITSSSSIG